MIYYKELSDLIISCAIEVHKYFGNGFLEKVYENALKHEFELRNVHCENQKLIEVKYKNKVVGEYYADFLIEDKIILELKTCKNIDPIHEAQLIHYLKATGVKAGYIINFGSDKKLEFKRFVC
jgi:GxxExxY protein